jgi:hypothetical protein
MQTLRRLLARTRLGSFLLLPLLSCGYPRPSRAAVTEALGRSSAFTEPKTILVSRRLDARTDPSMGGGALDDRQLAKIESELAVLRANGLIDIQDVYGPSDDGGYSHIITVQPAADAPAGLFTPVDQPSGDEEWKPVRRTPGWRVAIAHRKLVSVTEVLDPNSPTAERLSPGFVQASVEFRWTPTTVGELFDQGGSAFEEMPRPLQVAVVYAGDLDSRRTYAGRAWMTRGREGKEWRVTLFQCQRCTATQP